MDLEAFLGELADWAEERDPGFETIAYGDHPDQVADVRRGGERTAIVVHGGFWRPAFTRANTRALAVDLALRGWTTWNIEYRRTGVDDTLADVAARRSTSPARASRSATRPAGTSSSGPPARGRSTRRSLSPA